jgi:CPA2 family monovalent cation:H+ antiporter-2
MLKDQLKDVPFFSSLSKRELTEVAQQTDELDVAEGKTLAREGDFGHEFFVIVDGTAEVVRGGDRIAELGPGDFFGEMALLSGGRRNGDVVAVDFCRFLVLERRDFNQFTARHPGLRAAITSVAEERRTMNLAPPVDGMPDDQRPA